MNSPLSLGPVGDPTGLHGARWIRCGAGAGAQLVKGGEGILGALNGGMEPTGRYPFGPAFKVVLTESQRVLASLPGSEQARAIAMVPLIMRACGKAGVTDPSQLAYGYVYQPIRELAING